MTRCSGIREIIKGAFSAELLGAKLYWHGGRFWWFADRSVHVCWCLMMSLLPLLWWMLFSAFPGESGITGTRSSEWKTAAGGDSHGPGGSHVEWPSPHCSGELYHSLADCPTQGKCSTTSCVKITIVIRGERCAPGQSQVWSSELVFPMQELLQLVWKLKV